MSSDPVRQAGSAGSGPADLARLSHTINVNAARVSLIGLVIHDLAGGLFAGILAEDLLVEGCVVFNNGWVGPDRGHGHGFYLQNRFPSKKRILANVLFHQFSSGIKVSGSSNAWLQNVDVENNVSFDNGLPVYRRFGLTEAIFHQGGRDKSGSLRFIGNIMTQSDDSETAFKINAGVLPPGSDLEFSGNVVQGRTSFGPWFRVIVRDNLFAMPFTDAIRGRQTVENASPDNSPRFITEWNWNRYAVRNQSAYPLAGFVGTAFLPLSFQQWTSSTGFDRNGALLSVSSVQPIVRVIPVPSQPGRGFIAHWSPSAAGNFVADISSIVRRGQRFEIRHVFRLDAAPVVSGVYTGQSVSLSAVSPQPPDPIGMPIDRTIVRRPPAVYQVIAR